MERAILFWWNVSSYYRGRDDGHDVPNSVTPHVETVRKFDEEVLVGQWRDGPAKVTTRPRKQHESTSIRKEDLPELQSYSAQWQRSRNLR